MRSLAEGLTPMNEEFRMYLEIGMLVATLVLAGFTGWLAYSTWKLAKESHEASVRQMGVQTWLHLAARFDSTEIRDARGRLAEKLKDYESSKHDEITDEVLDVLEDIGTTYKLGLMNEELAISAFSFYACRWWEAAKTYIYEERKRNDDDEIFCDFEMFAKKMRPAHKELDDNDLKRFLADEAALRIKNNMRYN